MRLANTTCIHPCFEALETRRMLSAAAYPVGMAAAVPGIIQAENFDIGGNGSAYYDVDQRNAGGAYRSTEVDLQRTKDSGRGYNVGWTKSGEWLNYTVRISESGNYRFDARVAHTEAGGTFRVLFNEIDKTGELQVPATGSWQKWTTVSQVITLEPGEYVMRVEMLGEAPNGFAGNFNWFKLSRTTATADEPAVPAEPGAPEEPLAQAPAAPSQLSALAISASAVNLAWMDNSGNETGFRIERSADRSNWITVKTLSAGSTAWTAEGLSASTTYHFRIRAYNADGESAASNVVQATTHAPAADPSSDPDQGPGGTVTAEALLVVGNAAGLNASENLILTSLRDKGFTVSVADDSAVQTSSADGKELVVISKTVTSTNIGTKFNNVQAGVLFWEDNLQDELAGVQGTQSHYTSDRLDIDTDAGSHPLSAGFAARDDLVVYNRTLTSVTELSWGQPNRANPDAIIVAANEKGSSDVHYYGYDKGATLDDGRTAAGRRVFFMLYDDSFQHLTADGRKLWDAAVGWTAQLAGSEPEVEVPGTDTGTDAGGGSGQDTGTGVDQDNLVWSSPLVITRGGTYTGNFQSLDAGTPAILIKTSEPVIIENANLRGRGDLISSSVAGARITVRNTRGWGMNPEVAGKAAGRFLYAFNFASVHVEGNYMESTTGIVLNGNQAGGTVKILRNNALNIDGRLSDGNGGYQGGGVHKRAQFINLDKVQNVPGVEIAWNQVINEPYKSRVEDNINLYQSSGTATSPIRVHDNYIQGGYNADPANDTNYAGGGILLGDGHDGSGYAEAYNNVVVSTTNYGIAISGGHHQKIYNNRVISSGLLPDGRRIAAQNVGIYIWDYHNAGSGFNNNSAHDNLVGWMRGTSRNDWWVPDATSFTNNTRWAANPTLAMETAESDAWHNRLSGANIDLLEE